MQNTILILYFGVSDFKHFSIDDDIHVGYIFNSAGPPSLMTVVLLFIVGIRSNCVYMFIGVGLNICRWNQWNKYLMVDKIYIIYPRDCLLICSWELSFFCQVKGASPNNYAHKKCPIILIEFFCTCLHVFWLDCSLVFRIQCSILFKLKNNNKKFSTHKYSPTQFRFWCVSFFFKTRL